MIAEWVRDEKGFPAERIRQKCRRTPQAFPYPNHVSLIADILGRRTKLPVKQAEARDVLTPGVVYVAPPGSHMVIVPGGAIQLTHTALVHFVRPSADELFESAARAFGPAIAVILSGCGTDGATGATAVKAMGGTVIVQNEATSMFFGMPQAAIDSGAVDYVLPLEDIAARLVNLVGATRHDGIG